MMIYFVHWVSLFISVSSTDDKVFAVEERSEFLVFHMMFIHHCHSIAYKYVQFSSVHIF